MTAADTTSRDETRALMLMHVTGFAVWLLVSALGVMPEFPTLNWWLATIACYLPGNVATLMIRRRTSRARRTRPAGAHQCRTPNKAQTLLRRFGNPDPRWRCGTCRLLWRTVWRDPTGDDLHMEWIPR